MQSFDLKSYRGQGITGHSHDDVTTLDNPHTIQKGR